MRMGVHEHRWKILLFGEEEFIKLKYQILGVTIKPKEPRVCRSPAGSRGLWVVFQGGALRSDPAQTEPFSSCVGLKVEAQRRQIFHFTVS